MTTTRKKNGLVVTPTTRTKKARVVIDGQIMPNFYEDPILLVDATSKYNTKNFEELHSYYICDGLKPKQNKVPKFYKNYSVWVCGRKLLITNYSPDKSIDAAIYRTNEKVFNLYLSQFKRFGFIKNPKCYCVHNDQTEDIIGIVYSIVAIKHDKIKNLADNVKRFIGFIETETNKVSETVNNPSGKTDPVTCDNKYN